MKTREKKQIVVLVGFVQHKGKILMIQRFEPECSGAHLRWELPGGKISFDEKPQYTIEREINEETGFKVKAIDLAPIVQTHIWHYEKFDQHTIVLCYICKLIGGKINMKDHHTNDVKWIDPKSLSKIKLLVGTNKVIKIAINNKLLF